MPGREVELQEGLDSAGDTGSVREGEMFLAEAQMEREQPCGDQRELYPRQRD